MYRYTNRFLIYSMADSSEPESEENEMTQENQKTKEKAALEVLAKVGKKACNAFLASVLNEPFGEAMVRRGGELASQFEVKDGKNWDRFVRLAAPDQEAVATMFIYSIGVLLATVAERKSDSK
jgi:hypothetical protein